MTPTSLPASSYASGIIVSASMVRIAPPAKASTMATISGEESWKRAGGRADRFGQVGQEHRRQKGETHRPALIDRQADHHRLGNPVQHGSEHDCERGAALLVAVYILALTPAVVVDQPVAEEEDPAAGKDAHDDRTATG